MSEVVETTIGQLIEFQRGFDLPKEQFKKGIIPVISSNGILGYHNQYKVKAPGITIGRSGTVGLPHYIQRDFFPHNTTLFVKDFKGNHPKYIYYLLQTLGLNKRKTGSGVPTMNRNHIHPLKIKAHLNLNDQKQIGLVLSSLDEKIELNNKINAELEAMAKRLYDYWFVQFDFPDANGKPYKTSGGKMVYNKQLKRDIPEGWEVKTIGDYLPSVGGYAFKSTDWTDKGVPVIKIKDIKDDYSLDLTDCSYVNDEIYQITKRFIAEKGDVVIAMTGATIGKYAIVPNHKSNILVNQRVGLFRSGQENLLLLPFLINSFKQPYFRETVFALATGAAQPNISNEQINNIKLIYPDKSIVKLYNDSMNSLYNSILKNQQQSQHLTTLRDWLLPMLMNGQVGFKEEGIQTDGGTTHAV